MKTIFEMRLRGSRQTVHVIRRLPCSPRPPLALTRDRKLAMTPKNLIWGYAIRFDMRQFLVPDRPKQIVCVIRRCLLPCRHPRTKNDCWGNASNRSCVRYSHLKVATRMCMIHDLQTPMFLPPQLRLLFQSLQPRAIPLVSISSKKMSSRIHIQQCKAPWVQVSLSAIPRTSIEPSSLLPDRGSDVGIVVPTNSPSPHEIQGNPASEISMGGGTYSILAYHPSLNTAPKLLTPRPAWPRRLTLRSLLLKALGFRLPQMLRRVPVRHH